MTDPVWRNLNTAHACVERLTHDHATIRSAMAAGTSSVGHGLGDPAGAVEYTIVEAAALRRIASGANRYQNLIECALRALLEADTIRALAVTVVANTTSATAEARCDGWDRPECERNGVQNVWVDGANLFLCDTCWGRYRVQKHRATG